MYWRMIEAARTGNINVLYELIQEDPYVLERIDQVPFLDTPLHLAAFAGHIDFVMEMTNLKPSFARKLNQVGFSPMHLALQNDKTQAVLRLLKFDKALVRVKGREGLTPLHHVVGTGNLDLSIRFLEACPEAIEDVTVRDETAFHLAVKNDMFEAFVVLMGWLLRSCHEAAQRWENELLSWRDIEGNTVLHIAAIRNRPQVVKVLLENLSQDHINAKNLEGLTALDIVLEHQRNERQVDNREIMDMLSKAGGLRGSLLPKNPNSSININSFRSKMSYFQKFATMAARGKKGISNEMRNTFLVVTVLIITATYDASLNPPNKGDNLLSENYQVSSFPRFSQKANLPTGGHNPPQEFTDLIDVSSMFWLYNTLTFWVALGLTAYLLPSRTICLFLLITLSLFGSCYMLLVAVVSWKLQYLISPKPLHLSYHALSIVNYSLSTLIAVLVATRIAGYVFCRFVPRRKIFCLVQLLSFLSIASCIVTPAVLNVEFILRSNFFL
ncbi:Ankyrin repeat-containing protein, putative [Theobroma cacao]|uniref:Ankyrin repeat-containing protein, putative n=1 Tax=Theobroma cacao TaxID=3641 RepID=A0A061FU78_THECC|nr:Ankyrin repeat-containing protein, putative [Theobroma cacao]